MDHDEEVRDSSRRQLLKMAGAAAVAGFTARVIEGAPVRKDVLVEAQKAQGSIVLGRNASKFQEWVAHELQRYVRLLSGADLPLASVSQAPPTGVRILLGGPDSNELVATAQQRKLVNFAGLKQDGFVLQQIELDGAPALDAVS